MRFLIFLLLIGLAGCQSTASYQKKAADPAQVETVQDVRSAIESVAGAVTKGPVRVKYCPTCGRRFSPSVTECVFDHAELKEVE